MKKYTLPILMIFLVIMSACSDKEKSPETKSDLEFQMNIDGFFS
jgi:major membrane immunogen (membrane-anchored lipoprotein)